MKKKEKESFCVVCLHLQSKFFKIQQENPQLGPWLTDVQRTVENLFAIRKKCDMQARNRQRWIWIFLLLFFFFTIANIFLSLNLYLSNTFLTWHASKCAINYFQQVTNHTNEVVQISFIWISINLNKKQKDEKKKNIIYL